jgi:hypothetical protein
MVRFRTSTRTRASETIKVGPFHFKVGKPLGRAGVRVSAGTRRPWHRARFGFSTTAGAARRRNGRKRRWG